MIIFKLDHDDFILTVETADILGSYSKAKRKQGEAIRTSAIYKWPLAKSVKALHPERGKSLIDMLAGVLAHPIFFENKEYVFDIEFKSNFETPRVYSRLREISEKFYYRPERKILAGTVNYGNDIGKSDIVIRYGKQGNVKEFAFEFEVFPTKLDYRKDYDRIVMDIQKEYPLLVLDFLKKTYSNFKQGKIQTNDLVWWQVFGGLYGEFLSASKFILNKPHRRLMNEVNHVKLERIKQLTPALEEEIAEFRTQPERYYRTERKVLSVDTPENRFFKYALNQITQKYLRLKGFLKVHFASEISKEFSDELDTIENNLILYKNHPLFKSIGNYKGLKQESLLLQKGTGYSSIYKNWIMLNSGMDFFDGIQKIEMKDIAELYEIWCFLEMKKILEGILGTEHEKAELVNVVIDRFTFSIKEGKQSRITFKKGDGEIVDLFHEYKFNQSTSGNYVSHTVEQRPDIVLQFTKSDLKDKYVFTYLYDAKYRLQSDDREDSPDIPPNDAINQMHRYRDAIYYNDKSANRPHKEVIGGYILFPGDGNIDTIKEQSFFNSIEKVNIGAYPLRPNDYINRQLLEEHLKSILGLSSENILNDLNPQKEMRYYEPDSLVLVGIVKDGEQRDYFRNQIPSIYHIPIRKDSKIARWNKIRFFAPWFKGEGVIEYYECLDIRIEERKDIFENIDVPNRLKYGREDHAEYLYYVIQLGKRTQLKQTIKPSLGNQVYWYAKLSDMSSAKNFAEFKKEGEQK